MALVFTGDEFADGGYIIRKVLKKHQIRASFFFTGRFYTNPAFVPLVWKLKRDGNYLGAHSDQHLLYCDWVKRDSLLVSEIQFREDLKACYSRMQEYGIGKKDAPYFLPPYEWYNRAVVDWTAAEGLKLVNFTPGTRSAADYTYPAMGKSYLNSEQIFKSVIDYEARDRNGLNGFMLLIHIGTDPQRKDKFYNRLDELIITLKKKGYRFGRIDEMLN